MRAGVFLAAALALGQGPTQVLADDQPKGLEQLRGSWAVTKSEPRFEAMRLVFDGDKVTFVFDENEKRDYKVKIDPSAKPAWIDMARGKDNIPGIYEVTGDTFRLCFPEEGDKRPAEFKAAKGSVLVTLKREKK